MGGRQSAPVVVGLVALVVAACVAGLQAHRSAASPAGRVFYVSAAGSDRASGLTPNRAWRTVSRVDRARLRPGDQVLFRGGDTFAGVTLLPRNSGTARSPIVFGSYGSGHATITATDSAIFLTNGVSHLVVSNLDLSTGGVGFSSIIKDAPSGPPTTDLLITG